jgi:hypothetical protein
MWQRASEPLLERAMRLRMGLVAALGPAADLELPLGHLAPRSLLESPRARRRRRMQRAGRHEPGGNARLSP